MASQQFITDPQKPKLPSDHQPPKPKTPNQDQQEPKSKTPNQEPKTIPNPEPTPPTLNYNYSNRVLLKTILQRNDGGLGLVGRKMVIGGWIKSYKEIKKQPLPSSHPTLADHDSTPGENKDVTCIELLQTRVPLFRSIVKMFGGGSGAYTSRSKLDSIVPNRPLPSLHSIINLLVSDGSCVANLQVRIEFSEEFPFRAMPIGSSIIAEGVVNRLPSGGKQSIEFKVEKVVYIGSVEEDKYPLSKKRLPLESLREFSHFRPRTTTDAMKCAEDYFRFLCKWVLNNCEEDMKFVVKRIDKNRINLLQEMAYCSYDRITYTKAVEILEKVTDKTFETQPKWGISLTPQHLSYLADEIYKAPLIVYNYPKEVKPFYTRSNDDRKTVAAFDMVVPKGGILITGCQNEERIDYLEERIREVGLRKEEYEWYLDLGRHGTVKHSGFSMGFDLMVMVVSGIPDVRDAIPFPRTQGMLTN